MKNLKLSLIIFFMLFFALNIFSQVNKDLVLRYSGTQNMDEAKAIVLDPSNNVYVTGRSLSSANGYDIVTIKYNTAGVILWTAVYNGSANGDDQATDILIDGSNIYVIGTTKRTPSTGTDYVTIKYNGTTGAQLWSSVYSGIGVTDDIPTKIAVKNNSAYVTGKGYYTSSTNADYVTIKYNGSTGDSIWVKNYNGSGNANDSATCIKVSVDSSVFVTGKSYGTSGYDYATLRYSASGTQNWVKRYNGSSNGNDIGISLSLYSFQPSPDIYVTGQSDSTGAGANIVTIKYTFSSIQTWDKKYNGSGNGDDVPTEINFTGSDLYVIGKCNISGEGSNIILLKYNTLGDTSWTRTYNGSANGNDEGTGMTIDASGFVYVCGKSNEVSTGNDYTVIKYTTSGNKEWKYSYNNSGSGSDIPTKIGVDATSDRNVYVTGASFSGTTGTNYATVKLKQDRVLDLNVFIQGFYRPLTNSTIKDTVRVLLYDAAAVTIIDSAKVFLDTLGKGRLYFKTAANSTSYRIAIKHRNSIETWGSGLNLFSNLFLTYDFTTAANKSYGNNQIQVDASPVEYAIYGGDVNKDGSVDLSDLSIIDNDSYNFASGYLNSDINGDGFIDLTDLTIADNNSSSFVSVIRP
jgi:Beta-propeller repeat